MATPNYFRLIVRSWRYVLLATLLGLVLALAFSLVQPLRYSSSVKLLITQTNPAGLDPYTAVKSTERIAQNLAQLVYTSAFYSTVVKDKNVDTRYFPTDELKRRTMWESTIETEVSPGTGVMNVIAYHTNRTQATIIAQDVAMELAKQAPEFFGYSVRAQVIDAPVPSRFFAKPNFFVNAAYGAIAGLLLGLAWVLGKNKD
jgi:capsular polysaccharide biosynthesis protein